MNNDLISRKALKKVIGEYIDEYSDLDNEGNHCEKWCAMKEAEMAIDDAPTVCNDNYSMGYQDGVKKVLSERPQGERAERALAIIDRLRTDEHINNKEQGVLRRAILLPERPQGEWIVDTEHSITMDFYKCTNCNYFGGNNSYRYCPNCGADLRVKDNESNDNL